MHGNWGHPRGHVSYFTDEEDQQIRALTLEGLSASLIGQRLGRTRNSIIGRMHRIGIKRDLPVSKKRPATSRKGIKMPPRVKKVAVRAQVLPPEPPPLVPSCEPINILGITDGAITQCRYFVSDNPRLYCGAETKPGTSWCPYHAAMVFNPAAVRR